MTLTKYSHLVLSAFSPCSTWIILCAAHCPEIEPDLLGSTLQATISNLEQIFPTSVRRWYPQQFFLLRMRLPCIPHTPPPEIWAIQLGCQCVTRFGSAVLQSRIVDAQESMSAIWPWPWGIETFPSHSVLLICSGMGQFSPQLSNTTAWDGNAVCPFLSVVWAWVVWKISKHLLATTLHLRLTIVKKYTLILKYIFNS